MAKRYPIIVRKKKAKNPGHYGNCQSPKCPERAEYRIEVQETYMRGDDEFYRLCAAHTDGLERGANPFAPSAKDEGI